MRSGMKFTCLRVCAFRMFVRFACLRVLPVSCLHSYQNCVVRKYEANQATYSCTPRWKWTNVAQTQMLRRELCSTHLHAQTNNSVVQMTLRSRHGERASVFARIGLRCWAAGNGGGGGRERGSAGQGKGSNTAAHVMRRGWRLFEATLLSCLYPSLAHSRM